MLVLKKILIFAMFSFSHILFANEFDTEPANYVPTSINGLQIYSNANNENDKNAIVVANLVCRLFKYQKAKNFSLSMSTLNDFYLNASNEPERDTHIDVIEIFTSKGKIYSRQRKLPKNKEVFTSIACVN